ncbi:polyunsaturated fatty acid 5-lipoxygenase-like isoform X2 [Mya arenaria]|nr:polyunsaturated fatty acid 5-lipoxygenase-like isoform X2 [Mya arenaria]
MKWFYTGKATNTWGDELQGYAVVRDTSPLDFAGLDILRPGKVNQVRLRFFNLCRGDDASDDFRCAFLKFGEQEDAGPLDLAFTTGRMASFTNIAGLQEFCSAVDGDEDAVRDWALKSPDNYFSLVDGIRRSPECRTELDYNSHVTYRLATDDEHKIVRFRLHGNNDDARRLKTREDQEEAWKIQRPDIQLPADTYLTDRLLNIASNHKTMTLQVQVRDFDSTNPTECEPTRYWEEEAYPWQDLADVTLTFIVPKLMEERANYDFLLLPDGLQIETPVGGENYANLVSIQEKVLTSTARKKHPEEMHVESPKTTTYLVHVETGNHLFSGTDAGVYIALYGTKGRTKRYLLDKLFHDDFERGSKESYYITTPVIGDVKCVQVFLIGGKFTFKRIWFLSNIVLFDLTTRKMFEIPCNKWIDSKITLPTGEAKLATQETHLDRKYLRQIYLEEQQNLLKWSTDSPGLPGQLACDKYDSLPLELKYSSERQIEKKKIILDVVLKLKLNKYMRIFQSFDSLEDFKDMAKVVPETETSKAILEDDRWRQDAEYGREMLDGVNPVLIRRLTRSLPQFPVTDEMVGEQLDRGMTLKEEMEFGHIYYINYKHMVDVERKDKFVPNPLIMFYVTRAGQLKPIAIQLEQKPGPTNPIWTPKDQELGWLLAKTYVKSADSHYQTVVGHLQMAHIVMESFTLAMYRQLPQNHPVHKLLIQHTRFAVAGAQMGRDLLLDGPESVFQKILALPGNEREFMRAYFADFHMDQLIPPKNFAERGVDDRELLPGYHYRDDAMLVWDKIAEYVEKVLRIFYSNDSDVKEDSELQEFVKDIRENGMTKRPGKSNGFPETLKTIKELTEFASMIIFHSSVYHASMNFSQSDYFSFGPNYPGAMRRAPPTSKAPVTEKDIMEALPTKADQAVSIAFSHYLSEPLSDEIYLGEFKESFYTETEVRDILDWFADEMSEISRQIRARNDDLEIPYVYLIPDNIPKSAGQ